MTDAGQPTPEVDHVVPLAAGGRDDPANMIALCQNYHVLKTYGRSRTAFLSNLRRKAADLDVRMPRPH